MTVVAYTAGAIALGVVVYLACRLVAWQVDRPF